MPVNASPKLELSLREKGEESESPWSSLPPGSLGISDVRTEFLREDVVGPFFLGLMHWHGIEFYF